MNPQPVGPLADLNAAVTQQRLARAINRPSSVDPFEFRMGTVVTATDVHTYGVALTGDGVTRPMGSISDYAPQVGDPVWVAQLGPTYLVVGLRLGKVRQSGQTSVGFVATSVGTANITFPVPYQSTPDFVHSVHIGSNLDVLSNLQALNATSAVLRLFTRALGNITGTAILHWEASGV